MNYIKKRLMELKDEKYAEFQAKLMPTIDKEKIIGVRVPILRKYAKEIIKDYDYSEFMKELPHNYYDENMLHALLISEIKDYEKCMEYLKDFLPYIDNWAVCDILSPKIFKKNKSLLIENIKEWTKSDKEYTVRFGIEMIMSHFLDDDFNPEYLEIPAVIRSDEYYVNMMIAWFFAEALAKQWDFAIKYIENNRFEVWVHNKTIQKARESRKITPEKKEYLKSLKK